MTSITAQTTATLDGVIDAPPAEALLPYMTDAGRQGALDLALAADALLLRERSSSKIDRRRAAATIAARPKRQPPVTGTSSTACSTGREVPPRRRFRPLR